MLDENIISFAQQGRDASGNEDDTYTRLLVDIADNCHSLVFGESFWPRYVRQVQRLGRVQFQEPRVMPTLKLLTEGPEKQNRYIFEDDMQEIPDLENAEGVDGGDYLFARAAASVPGSIL